MVVYTANPFHPVSSIMIHDVIPFEDLLRSTAKAEDGYLMINSSGGDGNAAEKLLMMCRQRFAKSFNVIVPDYAKSAATMIALGSDKILMGYLAELGPIDPQFRTSLLPGPGVPARSFIDGLDLIRDNVTKKGDPIQMYYPMLTQINPQILARAQSAIAGSKKFAEKWLKKHMLKKDPEQAKKVARWLSEGKRYKSHGNVIDFDEAHNILKLNVEKIDQNSELWSDIWELYCRSIFFLQQRRGKGAAKLFESEKASLTFNVQIQVGAQTPTSPKLIGPQRPPFPPPRLPSSGTPRQPSKILTGQPPKKPSTDKVSTEKPSKDKEKT
ncbi:MAG: hypothetical protein IBV52_08935 [Candidatus Bathyarchaeota archaeon]